MGLEEGSWNGSVLFFWRIGYDFAFHGPSLAGNKMIN